MLLLQFAGHARQLILQIATSERIHDVAIKAYSPDPEDPACAAKLAAQAPAVEPMASEASSEVTQKKAPHLKRGKMGKKGGSKTTGDTDPGVKPDAAANKAHSEQVAKLVAELSVAKAKAEVAGKEAQKLKEKLESAGEDTKTLADLKATAVTVFLTQWEAQDGARKRPSHEFFPTALRRFFTEKEMTAK